MPIAISLVIPAHNESSRVESGFDRLRPALEPFGVDNVEVIVVDDGSSDDTGRTSALVYGQLPHSLVVRQETNQGKGAAVRLGISYATGSHVVVCDADMAVHPTHLPDMVAALRDAPVAFGSRTLDGAIRYDSWVRTRAGAAFNAMVRRRVGTTLRDTQCGFKGFQVGAARTLAALGVVDRFAYDVEILYLAARLDLAVTPVPVTWDDVAGSSVHVARDSRRMWRDIRGLRTTEYECPVVRVPLDVDVDAVRDSARSARQSGLALARGVSDALVIFPRHAALAALEVANAVRGSLGVASVDEMRGRSLEAL